MLPIPFCLPTLRPCARSATTSQATRGHGKVHLRRHRLLTTAASLVLVGLVPLLAVVPVEAEITSEWLAPLSFRELGPALMGGRIADIAVDPKNSSRWFVAVGSGGVWRTENAGTTWQPLFDDESVYSTSIVAIDPERSHVIWVGTGENVSGRHVGWGDGVYKSVDGGETWENVGLKNSQHIGAIVIDPNDPDVVFVAAEGPLWSAGGDRGVYKTTDGGRTWKQVLGIDPDTGVTDLEVDPQSSTTLYAASYQRRRHVWAHLAGGPGSGIHKSTDGGETWKKLSRGLPKGDMGKIGLSVSPVDPKVIYATIEASKKERGFYRSVDRGESWEKRNSYLSNGTGPHYYQEIVASPTDVDHVYQMDVFYHVTRDGGANFEILGDGRQKHSDNHALVIDPTNPRHLLSGTDAGLYESFDDGTTWRHFPNLPISQFYKLALDNSEPFYNILGGAQDLGTLLGPSRTTHSEGIRNQDWTVPLGADGYACAFDPDDPNVMYMEWQGGRLNRYDHRSGEVIDIQPVPAPGDAPERFNWDAPLLVSPHSNSRLYFASQRVWRSEDKGDSWTAVSEDLTLGAVRYERKMGDSVPGVDALYDNGAMSLYATITSLSESPLVEGLLYAGTDDGLIQVSEDGGQTWRRAASFGDVPDFAFINDVVASKFDPNTVFAAVDAHKVGDLRALLFRSTDRGRSWKAIASDLPDGHVVWSLVQDHEQDSLLFVGTEFGVYVSLDGGDRWIALSGGMPTIAVRDLAIQARDSDLVAATFGRGFYILDDYSALRSLSQNGEPQEASLFPVRDAWAYVPYVPSQAVGMPTLGSDSYKASNPAFGTTLTYYLPTSAESAQDQRRASEKALREQGKDVPFPGWEALRAEEQEPPSHVVLTVRDARGEVVRTLFESVEEGLHRINWDLRYPPVTAVDLKTPGFRPPWASDPQGPLVVPGTYSVELAIEDSNGRVVVGPTHSFAVKAVPGATFGSPDANAVAAFHEETSEFLRQVENASKTLSSMKDRLDYLKAAIKLAPKAPADLLAEVADFEAQLLAVELVLSGDSIRRRYNEAAAPSIARRVWQVAGSHWETTQAPTKTQVQSLAIAKQQFTEASEDILTLADETLPALEGKLEAAGAPYTPGRRLQPASSGQLR